MVILLRENVIQTSLCAKVCTLQLGMSFGPLFFEVWFELGHIGGFLAGMEV